MGRFFAPLMKVIYGNIDVWLVIGFVLGLVLFIRGLRNFRRGLMVADTPIIPIRSVAMGITQVHGHAGGDTPFPSPVRGLPCYAFHVQIERYDKRNGWQHYRTDQNGQRFYLSDDSGRIHVDPLKAEIDVPVTGRRIVGDPPMNFSLAGFLGWGRRDDMSDVSLSAKTDDELLEYAAATFPGLFDGYSLSVRESHQAGKADTSGTAKAMVGYFNRLGVDFSLDRIAKERDPDVQRRDWKIAAAGMPKATACR